MSLFRSEEHLQRWLTANDARRGAVLDLAQTWRLSVAWYVDPRTTAWKARTPVESQAVLARVGLVDEFWQFT